MKNVEWICPRCGRTTKGYGATSRRDNTTKICSECGTAEALFDWKINITKKIGKPIPTNIIQKEKSWLKEVDIHARQIC